MIKLGPIVILIFIVLGGIWLGWFTATEAGGIGAFAALLLSILKRTLTWTNLWQVLKETGHVTAAICFLLISAHLYSKMIVVSGIPGVMEGFIQSSGLGPGELLAIYIVTIILLGTILDSGSIMLITVPLAFPVLQNLGVDLIWFGIVTIIAVEIGLLTPPLGIACFVIHNNLQRDDITVGDIFTGRRALCSDDADRPAADHCIPADSAGASLIGALGGPRSKAMSVPSAAKAPGPATRRLDGEISGGGAGGETRTPTLSPELDFESSASTNSATPAATPDDSRRCVRVNHPGVQAFRRSGAQVVRRSGGRASGCSTGPIPFGTGWPMRWDCPPHESAPPSRNDCTRTESRS